MRRPTVSVVLVTHNRRGSLVATLARLAALPERPPLVVVDNASTDGTVAEVRERWPDVTLLALDRNLGAAGRTLGVRAARTPYVAFSDDDSWWAPGALHHAGRIFDTAPELGLLAARVVVRRPGRPVPAGDRRRPAGDAHDRVADTCGPTGDVYDRVADTCGPAPDADDPVCAAMAAGPPSAVVPGGHDVLGFLACGAVVRRSAYLAVGGFHPRYGVGGEEELLALDLTAAGWRCCHVPAVVAVHAPDSGHGRPGRRRREVRNALWTTWLRRRPAGVARRTVEVVAAGWSDGPHAVGGLFDAVAGLPWVLRERDAVDASVELWRAALDRPSAIDRPQRV